MKHSHLLFAVSLAAIASTPALAQDNSAPLPEGEIVVTATRTESLASKTPVALTAISGEGLRDAGITNPTALAGSVPNLSIDRNSGGVQITIRGVTSTDTTEKGDPSAAFLLDGIYIARPQAQEVSFLDVQRVEVLRGPQGTLYGRNTTAGLINVITNRPTFNFGGSADVGYGNFGAWQATGVVNVPVSDDFALRGAVNYDRRDNYLIGGPALTGRIDPFKENLTGRLSALYKWSTGDIVIRADYSDIGGTPYDLVPLRNFYAPTINGVNPSYIGGEGKRFRRENAPISWDTDRNNKSWGVSAEVNQELGPVALTYVGSYREFERDETDARISADGSLAYRLNFVGHYSQNSQELRLATNGTGPLKLQAGGYYFKEKSDVALKVLLVPNPGVTGDGSTAAFFQDPTIAESYAFFGQGTYSLTDTLRVTAGVRYSHDDKSRIGFAPACTSFFTCAPPAGVAPTNNASESWSKTTWRAGIDYDVTSTTLLYGVVSTGYKAGGFNDGCLVGTAAGCARTEDTLFYNPETLTSYEGGIKTRLLNNAIRLNLSGFHYSYRNLQLTQVVAECSGPGSAPCSVTTNGTKASVSGAEVEGVIAPSRNDRVDFSIAYLDAHYSDYRPNATTNFSGRALDRSPKWSFTMGYQHTFQLGNAGDLVASVRTKVTDDYHLLVLGTSNFYRQPGYSKTDLTLTYNAPEKRWYVQGFLKNLEDANVVTTVVVGTRSSVQLSDPRTYGVRAGVKF